MKILYTSVIITLVEMELCVYLNKEGPSATVFQIFTENNVNSNTTNVNWENGKKY